MSELNKKIDFEIIMSVERANPNGDPLAGNRPRETSDGCGEISDVCLKRKIRNRLQDMGEAIFVQSDGRSDDGNKTLKERAEKLMNQLNGEKNGGSKKSKKKDEADPQAMFKAVCEKWIDVRSFGQVFAFKSDDENTNGVSLGVRGPVTITSAISVDPIVVADMQITKSVSTDIAEGKTKGKDTMGHKYSVDFGVYVARGSINCQLAEKTGFTYEDAMKIKEALSTLFENDESSARPSGTMEVCKLIWWEHEDKTPPTNSAKVFRSVSVTPKVQNPKSYFDYEVKVDKIEGCVEPEVIDFV